MLNQIQSTDWLLMLIAFISTLALAALLVPAIIDLYRRQGWIEQPEKSLGIKKAKTTHQDIVPRGGGLVIFLSILTMSLFLLRIDLTIIAILGGALILTISGVWDDIYNINPLWRLALNFVVAILVIWAGISIKFVTNPFAPGTIDLSQQQILGWVLTFIFIVWNINIVNWSKGVDGQMPGFVGIAAIFIGILSLRFWSTDQSNIVFNNTMLSMIVAGAFFGFLIWNFYPQKIMPGYGGGALGGYFLSVLAILSGAKVATIFMVLAIPTADAVFTISRRLIAGKSPFLGDRGHLHHKLLDNLGWGRRRVAIFYWVVALLMGLLSLFLNTQGKIIMISIATILTFIFLIWAKIKSLKENK